MRNISHFDPLFSLFIALDSQPGQNFVCASTEIRTLVLALKGLRPGPLDDGGVGQDFTITPIAGQAIACPFEQISQPARSE